MRVDPRRLNTTGEAERSSDRGSLVSYFRDIAEIPTLLKEQEVLLAKEIEAATHELREGLVTVPWTACEAVRIWEGLRAENRATGKMCESFGSGSPEGEDLGARIDPVLGKIAGLPQGAADTVPIDSGRRSAPGIGTTGCTGRKGARCSRTPIGPIPGPPPPCGIQNVLCRFRWQTSAP